MTSRNLEEKKINGSKSPNNDKKMVKIFDRVGHFGRKIAFLKLFFEIPRNTCNDPMISEHNGENLATIGPGMAAV